MPRHTRSFISYTKGQRHAVVVDRIDRAGVDTVQKFDPFGAVCFTEEIPSFVRWYKCSTVG